MPIFSRKETRGVAVFFRSQGGFGSDELICIHRAGFVGALLIDELVQAVHLFQTWVVLFVDGIIHDIDVRKR